jgi:hypothetical protein
MATTGTEISWLQLFSAALGGGLTVKIVDIIYQEVRRRLDQTRSATKFVDEHLDPLLKAADELVGKLHSLATEDFKSISKRRLTLESIDHNDFGSLLFLFGRFWAQIEIIRLEGLSIGIAKDARGKKLQSFFACLESRKIRIVDRISQRAIGELFISPSMGSPKTLGYIEFVKLVETDERAKRWIGPLAELVSRTVHIANRQKLLAYGVVVHALIDTLDLEHNVTNKRPSYPGKLTTRTWKDLKYRVFDVYLKFVDDKAKFIARPIRHSRKG